MICSETKLPKGKEQKISQGQLEMPTLMRIMEDVFISSIAWLRRSPARVVRLGITHIVIPEHLVDR